MTEFWSELILAVIVVTLGYHWRLLWIERIRHQFLSTYRFPMGLFGRLKKDYPELSEKEYHLVSQALRHYFMAYVSSKFRFVGMPSRIVDDLWHLFILDTKAYARFCQKAFGRFFHHVPASSYTSEQSDEFANLRRTWVACCRIEGIHPVHPTRLPLLFAIDKKVGIPGAVEYSLGRREDAESGSDVVFVDTFGTVTDGGADSGGGDAGGGDGGGGCGGGCGGG